MPALLAYFTHEEWEVLHGIRTSNRLLRMHVIFGKMLALGGTTCSEVDLKQVAATLLLLEHREAALDVSADARVRVQESVKAEWRRFRARCRAHLAFVEYLPSDPEQLRVDHPTVYTNCFPAGSSPVVCRLSLWHLGRLSNLMTCRNLYMQSFMSDRGLALEAPGPDFATSVTHIPAAALNVHGIRQRSGSAGSGTPSPRASSEGSTTPVRGVDVDDDSQGATPAPALSSALVPRLAAPSPVGPPPASQTSQAIVPRLAAPSPAGPPPASQTSEALVPIELPLPPRPAWKDASQLLGDWVAMEKSRKQAKKERDAKSAQTRKQASSFGFALSGSTIDLELSSSEDEYEKALLDQAVPVDYHDVVPPHMAHAFFPPSIAGAASSGHAAAPAIAGEGEGTVAAAAVSPAQLAATPGAAGTLEAVAEAPGAPEASLAVVPSVAAQPDTAAAPAAGTLEEAQGAPEASLAVVAAQAAPGSAGALGAVADAPGAPGGEASLALVPAPAFPHNAYIEPELSRGKLRVRFGQKGASTHSKSFNFTPGDLESWQKADAKAKALQLHWQQHGWP